MNGKRRDVAGERERKRRKVGAIKEIFWCIQIYTIIVVKRFKDALALLWRRRVKIMKIFSRIVGKERIIFIWNSISDPSVNFSPALSFLLRGFSFGWKWEGEKGNLDSFHRLLFGVGLASPSSSANERDNPMNFLRSAFNSSEFCCLFRSIEKSEIQRSKMKRHKSRKVIAWDCVFPTLCWFFSSAKSFWSVLTHWKFMTEVFNSDEIFSDCSALQSSEQNSDYLSTEFFVDFSFFLPFHFLGSNSE